MNDLGIPEISFQESQYKITPLQEEASTRRYFLIEKEGSIQQVLCKDVGINWDFLRLTQYLTEQGIRVPQIYSIDPENYFILQEFCGLQDMSIPNSNDYNIYLKTSIDLMIRIHNLEPHPIVQNRDFDYEKLHSEVEITLGAFGRFKELLSLETDLSEDLRFFFQSVCRFLNDHPDRVFTHRDFHSRNILLDKRQKDNSDSELVLIDYQDARMGTPQYDLSSILYDAYKPISTELRLKMLNYYQEKSGKKLHRFKETFYLQSLQRSFKALGTYMIQVGDKKNRKFLPSLKSCLENLEEIAQLGHFPDSIYIFSTSFQKEWEKIQ